MASICTRKGIKVLRFILGGKEREINLAGCDKKTCQQWLGHVEQLIAAKMLGTVPPMATMQWANSLDDRYYKKLVGRIKGSEHTIGLLPARAGSIPQSEPKPCLLGEFLEEFIAKHRGSKKPNTITNYDQSRKYLVERFGANRLIDHVTAGDADDFRLWLTMPKANKGKGLAENTARKRCAIAKIMFRDAQRHGVIATNPFGDMKGLGIQANRERDVFVTREVAAKVLEACPDSQWRLIFALCRFAGLRCPSEILKLRLADIDWERQTILIRSPKTEAYEDKATRLIPIFPEIRPHLEQVWDDAPEGTVYVITRYRVANINLRTQLCKIVRRAGFEPWEKLFQNLRASAETELAAENPPHVVCAWIGHSQVVAMRHYLQVTDDHIANALAKNPIRNPMTSAETMEHGKTQEAAPTENPADSLNVAVFANSKVLPVGLEPTTY